jgi:hypothetical protein
VIPRNIFLMWDRPRNEWPALVELCIGLWEKLNPKWNVEVYDIEKARRLVCSDVDTNVFNSLKVQHQSDLVRTKLLWLHGGIWVDASCLPHIPVDQWIDDFETYEYASIPSLKPGQVSDNWFLLSKQNGLIMSKQYEALVRYWRTPKINLPQDQRSIDMIAERWEEFMSDYSAHQLRVAPYFLWQYLFRRLAETDEAFAACFKQQRYFAIRGECAFLIRALRSNQANGIANNPIPDELREFLFATTAPLSKLHHSATWLNYPLVGFEQIILKRAGLSVPTP